MDLVTDAADRFFHYSIPPELQGKISPGSLVAVPFGRRQQYGYVIALLEKPEVERVRPIEGLISRDLLNPEQLALIPWLAERYYCRMIEVLRAIIPAGNRRGGQSAIAGALLPIYRNRWERGDPT